MSEIEYHKGKLKRLCVEDIDELFKKKYIETVKLYGDTDEEILEDYENTKKYLKEGEYVWYHLWLERCSYDDSKQYVLVKGNIYEIKDEELDDYNVTILTKVGDEEYEYYSSFYNGGTYLTECLENELEKLV